LLFEKFKKRLDRLNPSTENSHSPSYPVSSESPSNTNSNKNIIHTFIDKDRKANALYIAAQLNNRDIAVAINSGAHINFIHPDLIDLPSKNKKNIYNLSGPVKTPLKLLSITNIELKINNIIYIIYQFVTSKIYVIQ